MKITKKDYIRVTKILKKHIPYYEFERTEEGQIYRPGVMGSDSDFVEIAVDTLFDLVLTLSTK